MRGTAADDLVAVDLDGDGDTDLATANAWDGTVRVHLSHRDGTFGSSVAGAASGGYAHSVAAGDLNGDGRMDLATLALMSRGSLCSCSSRMARTRQPS